MFNLEAFKSGQNAVDREDNEWCYVGMINNDIYPIVAQRNGTLVLTVLTNDGECNVTQGSEQDLISMVSRHTELKKTYVEGDVWQFRSSELEDWELLTEEPKWFEEFDYRIHPLNEFIKAHKAGEVVMWKDAIVKEDFNWDEEWLEPSDFMVKPKTKIVYEWMWKSESSNDWLVSMHLSTEEGAVEHFGDTTYQKTGRSWEVET